MNYCQNFRYSVKKKIKKFISRHFKPQKYLGEKTRKSKRYIEAISLAQKISEIQKADWSTKSDWHKNGVTEWKLTEGIRMEYSDDHMAIYVWRRYNDQARSFCKILPAFLDYPDDIEPLLYDQPWVCI